MITSKIAPYEKKMERGAQNLREERGTCDTGFLCIKVNNIAVNGSPFLPLFLHLASLPLSPFFPESFEYNALIKLSSLLPPEPLVFYVHDRERQASLL